MKPMKDTIASNAAERLSRAVMVSPGIYELTLSAEETNSSVITIAPERWNVIEGERFEISCHGDETHGS